jgi:hypothetical protein
MNINGTYKQMYSATQTTIMENVVRDPEREDK